MKTRVIVRQFFSQMLKVAPIYCILRMIFVVLQRVSYVLLLQYSILWVTNSIESGKTFFGVAKIILIVFFLSVIITFYERLLYDKYTLIVREKMVQMLQKKVFLKLRNMPYALYDHRKMYEKVYRCINSVETEMFELYECFLWLLASLTSSFVLGGLFLELSIQALCIIVFVFVLSIINNKKTSEIDYERNRNELNYKRKSSYMIKLIYLPEHISEIKIQNAKNMLFTKLDGIYKECGARMNKIYLPLLIHKFLLPFFIEFVLGNAFLYCILLHQVILGHLSIGEFSALFFSVSTLNGNLSEILNSMLRIKSKLLQINELFSFLGKMDNATGKTINIPNKDIYINGISFSYNKMLNASVRDVTLSVPVGKKIAIVGTNGAGKTTLIKLIIRLLESQGGEILMGKKNIKEYNKEDYYKSFFVSFQDCNIYAIPIYNNVSMDIKYDARKVRECLLLAGMEETTIRNLDVCASREITEEGVVFSKGQRQKIALARALYSDANYIIMDEPSSAMDSIAEENFQRVLMNYHSTKTFIIISHRLTTTVNADLIYVMKDGNVVEKGTHRSLMGLEGIYKDMFQLQAKKYIEK